MTATTAPDPEFDELRPPLDRTEAVVEADRCLECGGPHAPAPCAVACPAGRRRPAVRRRDRRGRPGARRRDDLRREPARRHVRARLPGRGALRGRLRARPRGPAARSRSARSSATRPTGRCRAGRSAPARARAPNGLPRRRDRRRPRRPRLRRRARRARLRRSPSTTSAQEPGGLVRYAIAPYRQRARPAARGGARARGARRRRFGSAARIDTPRALASGAEDATRSSSGSAWARTPTSRLPGDELAGVWESLPFIEAIKTGAAAERRPAAWPSIGGGNTAIDVAREALRLGADDVTLALPAHRGRDARLPARGRRGAREGVALPVADGAGPLPRHRAARRRRVPARCALGEPDASGRRRPEPVPGTEFTLPADTVVKAIGQQPRAELPPGSTASSSTAARSSSTETGRTANPKYFAARRRDQRRRDASSRPCATASAPPAAIDGDLRWTA